MLTVEPLIVGASWPTPYTLLVTISQQMAQNAALVDETNYALGHLEPDEVVRISDYVVELRFAAAVPAGVWHLRIAGPESTTAVVMDTARDVSGPTRTRTWLQAGHYQPAAATVRFTFHTTVPVTVDWSVAAGTWWASLDDMVAELNTTLANRCRVELAPNHTTHRAHVRISTSGYGPAYSIAWSQSGDGSALRDRLGESGNVSSRATGTTWTDPVGAAWYSWLGASRIRRASTEELTTLVPMRDGALTQATHAPTAAPIVELDTQLRFGPPASASSDDRSGLGALEALLYDLDDVAGAQEPLTLSHWPETAASADTWVVAFGDDSLELVPDQVDAAGRVWSLDVSFIAEDCPW